MLWELCWKANLSHVGEVMYEGFLGDESLQSHRTVRLLIKVAHDLLM